MPSTPTLKGKLRIEISGMVATRLARSAYRAACLAVILYMIIIAFDVGNYLSFCFPMKGTSMDPVIVQGDLIIVEPVNISSVRVGDIVVYRSLGENIAHRVIAVQKYSGMTSLTVKGDNNPAPDGGYVTSASIVGRVAVTVPYAGALISLTPPYNALLLFIPACVFVLDYLSGHPKHKVSLTASLPRS